jgi:hypothetical protein
MTSQIKKLENLANIQNENLSKTETKMNRENSIGEIQ